MGIAGPFWARAPKTSDGQLFMGTIELISNPMLIFLFALLIGLKVILLVNLGSVRALDSVGYQQYAEVMRISS